MRRSVAIASLLLGLLTFTAVAGWPSPADAHNVTFRATVTVAADGTGVDVYVDDVIRNPVPNAAVSVNAAGGSRVALTETEPGLYVGTFPRPLQSGERLSVQVEVGAKRDKWSGSGVVAVGGENDWVLFHQHGVDGRTFSIVTTSVLGGLLVIIAIHEVLRWRRRRLAG